MSETRKLAAILVADVVGYSRLAGADEERTLARLRGLRSDLIDPAIAAHHGRIVKRTGDGSIVEFRSVVDAVRCAIEVQTGLIERNAGLPPERRIEFRVGIHVGDVVEEADGDLMGDGVNIAARLEGVAKPGAICLSEDAYRQVKQRLDLKVSDLGATQLKNIAQPVRVYSLEVGKPAARRRARPAPSNLFSALAALAAILALAGAAAWYFVASKPSAIATPAATAASSSFGPAVAVLPFANATGDAKNDALTLRLGQKAADYLGKYTWLRAIGRSGGAAKSSADPVAGARELGADYVVTGEVDSGADPPRATFHVDDAHSGARLWSQTLAPILEDPKSGAAEEELAGRAGSLIKSAIFNVELTRAKAKKEGERTIYDCVILGDGDDPDTIAQSRKCLEAAAQKEPLNANVWIALSGVFDDQRLFGWGLPPEEAGIEKRDQLADRSLQAAVRAVNLAPHAASAQAVLAWGYYAKCEKERFRTEAEKAVALNPYDADHLGWLGINLAFSGFWDEGAAFAEKAIKLTGASSEPEWWYAPAKRHWIRGEYQEAYDDFQRSYRESSPDAHTDLAYTLPFLGRIDEAKAHVATILKLDPTMTIRKNDDFYRLLCFEPAFREKMARALRQAGLPEGEARSN
jgi:class 3 adenylate cyclase/TolB-like protein